MTKSEHQKKVEEFMRLAGQEVPDKPQVPSEEVRLLRARLIMEENLETIRGLGIIVRDVCGNVIDISFLKFYTHFEPNLPEIIDGCCDLKVVTTGTLSACGIADEEPQRRVDENNLEKFGPGGHRDENGKWVKPPGHTPPNFDDLIGEQAGGVCVAVGFKSDK